jgi:hypothetical protein
VRLKVSKKLRTFFLADLIDLSEFSIVEQDMVSTAINTLDVHS